MGLLDQQIDQRIPAEFLREREGFRLVDPHQRRVQDEPALHAEIERELHGLDGVVAAIRIAGVIGLAHAGDEVFGAAPVGERARKGEEDQVAAGYEGGGQPAVRDGDRGIAGQRRLGNGRERLDAHEMVLAEAACPARIERRDTFPHLWPNAELDRMALRRLGREEVRELGRIYRRTASDLAIARAESRDPRLVNYLNSLVIRAHGRIYRADANWLPRVTRFFTHDFPQTFRRTWRYTLMAAIFFWLSFGISLGITMHDQDCWRGSAAFIASTIFCSALSRHSAAVRRVTVLSLSEGAEPLPWVCIQSAWRGVRSCTESGSSLRLVLSRRCSPHAQDCWHIDDVRAGTMVGSAILMPGNLSRADALKSRGLQAVRLIVGCAALLVVAATIEGFISPQPISPIIKLGIGLLTGVALYSYLLLAGREEAIASV